MISGAEQKYSEKRRILKSEVDKNISFTKTTAGIMYRKSCYWCGELFILWNL
jgi:hypothetical protein